MENHFGKGLMAGLQASHADTAAHAANFCTDYKRGFVLGYSHRMFEKTGDRQLSAWEAGILTRRYGLERAWRLSSVCVSKSLAAWRS